MLHVDVVGAQVDGFEKRPDALGLASDEPASRALWPVRDDDRAGAIITRTARPLQVIEGNSTFDQTYAVVLTRVPSADVFVTIDPYYDQVTLSGSTLIGGNTLQFTSGDYNTAQFVTVTPLDDTVKEGFDTDYLSHTLASADADTVQAQARYQIDGDPAVVSPPPQDIPAEKPLDTLLLADKPIDGTVHVWVDNVEFRGTLSKPNLTACLSPPGYAGPI